MRISIHKNLFFHLFWLPKILLIPKSVSSGSLKAYPQAALASQLQLLGMECIDLTILRIEQGSRFVPDYEVAILAKYFNISTDTLLEQKEADS